MTNYTAAHESRASLLGEARLDYPPNHIEVDNRLSWLLGRLDEEYGDQAFYVHLIRDQRSTAKSFNRRWNVDYSIMRAYSYDILKSRRRGIEVALDLWETVNANIRLFLRDKSRTMMFRLEYAPDDFIDFWRRVGARGDLDAALAEWAVRHNQSETEGRAALVCRKAKRLVKKLRYYIRDA